MSSTTPSATRNSANLARLQVEKRQPVVNGPRQCDPFYFLALGEGEGGWAAAPSTSGKAS